VRTAYGLVVSLTDDGRDKPTDLRVRISLFRAVRELLINVAKHATVGGASVELSRERDWLRIVVEDRGHGFDPTTGAKGGHGLFAIRERLRHLGGDIHVCSEPGHGTRVTLTAPIDSGDPTF
jgi:signal transduction histidine kinase